MRKSNLLPRQPRVKHTEAPTRSPFARTRGDAVDEEEADLLVRTAIHLSERRSGETADAHARRIEAVIRSVLRTISRDREIAATWYMRQRVEREQRLAERAIAAPPGARLFYIVDGGRARRVPKLERPSKRGPFARGAA